MAKNDTNIVVIQGNLVKDSELKQAGQSDLLLFAVANNRSYKENTAVNFFDCELWGKLGTSIHQYMKKGKRVTVTGELKQDRWEKEGGGTASKTKIVVKEIEMASDGKQSENTSPEPPASAPAGW